MSMKFPIKVVMDELSNEEVYRAGANMLTTEMTKHQETLIEALAAKKIIAAFNGDFLNCKVAIHAKNKTKWQKFSFVFDSADDCQGSRPVGKMRGAYSEHFAQQAIAIIVEHSNAVAQMAIRLR